MEHKRLRKRKKVELLEIIFAQKERIEALENELKKTKKALENRKIIIKEAGSIAEATLKLNDIFNEAQKVADEYILHVKENCKVAEKENKKLEKSTGKKTAKKKVQKEILELPKKKNQK